MTTARTGVVRLCWIVVDHIIIETVVDRGIRKRKSIHNPQSNSLYQTVKLTIFHRHQLQLLFFDFYISPEWKVITRAIPCPADVEGAWCDLDEAWRVITQTR